ncbi:T9SS type A sorting domain-containing protein [Spirosoma flavum]|uniref:T9SS type A sorting domain-containing protein n=1 Tax=Spirosoma flavum TaxID=2048557 RepID=A0ABW6ADI0_9BACT
MRFLLLLLGCSMTLLSLAQTSPKSIRIQVSYERSGKYLEQAVETIEAVNIVGIGTTVDYQAGRSVSLLPGFVAKNGSIFTANIKSVSDKNDFSLQLKAYPNPFDRSTIVDFNLPEDGKISLFVVDEKGQVIERLLENSFQTAGRHQVEWIPKTLSSGVYIPILKTERQQISNRILKK